MSLQVFISALIGGVIGYSTNWLAIKMLFRPLTEKYIGPYRIPFTPGLMPKKRADLAKNLGDTVADYLVTSDTLVAAFTHPDFMANLTQFLQDLWDKLATNEQSLDHLLCEAGLEQQITNLPPYLADRLLELLADPVWQKEMIAKLETTIRLESSSGRPLDILAASLTDVVSALLSSDCIQSQFLGQVTDLISTLQTNEAELGSDLLPLRIQEEVHNLILAKSPDWLDWLEDTLQRPDAKAAMQSLIQQFLGGSTLLKLLSAFIDPEKLADTLVQSLEQAEVRTRITTALLAGWQHILAQPVAKLSGIIPLEAVNNHLANLLELLSQPENIQRIQGNILANLQPADSSSPAARELRERLRAIAQQTLQQLVDLPGTRQAVQDLLAIILTRVLQSTPQTLLATCQPPSMMAIAGRLQAWLIELTQAKGQQLLSALRLPQVVEEQVNALDMLQVEDILLKVMREQLSAITNLGFLLGALIGTLTPYLSLIFAK